MYNVINVCKLTRFHCRVWEAPTGTPIIGRGASMPAGLSTSAGEIFDIFITDIRQFWGVVAHIHVASVICYD